MRYEDVAEYVLKRVGEGDTLQKWVYGKSEGLSDRGVFPVDPTRGRLLELIARMVAPERVLEVGSGAGYSALWFMKGMGPRGTLDAIEADPEVLKTLKFVIRKAGLTERVKVHHGQALDVLRELDGPFDIVFIDADKDGYPAYLDEALRLTRKGSVILADNMLYHGATLRGDEHRQGVRGIMEYTERIFSDPKLSSVIVPLGDGVAVSYRIK